MQKRLFLDGVSVNTPIGSVSVDQNGVSASANVGIGNSSVGGSFNAGPSGVSGSASGTLNTGSGS